MTSVAERNRRKKARTVSAAAVGAENPDHAAAVIALGAARPTVTVRGEDESRRVRRVTGLAWVRNKGVINDRQVRTGERYGALYRIDRSGDQPSIRSALASLETVRGGGGAYDPEVDFELQTQVALARSELLAARGAVHFHSGMIAALDLVCGCEKTPRDITKLPRLVTELEISLGNALDMLGLHWSKRRTGTAD